MSQLVNLVAIPASPDFNQDASGICKSFVVSDSGLVHFRKLRQNDNRRLTFEVAR